jgi:hypothetical protein
VGVGCCRLLLSALAAGSLQLAAAPGQAGLLLVAGHAQLDAWYRGMLRDGATHPAVSRPVTASTLLKQQASIGSSSSVGGDGNGTVAGRNGRAAGLARPHPSYHGSPPSAGLPPPSIPGEPSSLMGLADAWRVNSYLEGARTSPGSASSGAGRSRAPPGPAAGARPPASVGACGWVLVGSCAWVILRLGCAGIFSC